MKKTFIIAMAALMLLTAQCKKVEQKDENQVMVPITGTINFGGDSKTNITVDGLITPVAGDRIYIYRANSEGTSVYRGYMDCTPTEGQAFNCTGEIDEVSLGKECVFMYLGSNSTDADGNPINGNSTTISFANQNSVSINSSTHIIDGLEKFHVGSCKATVSMSGTVTLSMRPVMAIAYFKLTDANDIPFANSNVTVGGIYSSANINKADGTISGGTKSNIQVKTDNNGEFYMALVPESGYDLPITFSGDACGEGSVVFKYGINPADFYCYNGGESLTVTMSGSSSSDMVNFNDAAMGVSGLPLWSKKNLGATNEGTDVANWYGKYYSWGETRGFNEQMNGYPSDWTGSTNANYVNGTTKTDQSWPYYKWCSGDESSSGTPSTFFKYNSTGTSLENIDDAAHVNLGENWYMPTHTHFVNLFNNTYCEYTTNYNGVSGLNGYVVYKVKNENDKGLWKDSSGTIKKQGTSSGTYSVTGTYTSSDTHIFLPLAGRVDATNLGLLGESGRYWTKDGTDSEKSKAHSLELEGTTFNYNKKNSRKAGNTIRPVYIPSAK